MKKILLFVAALTLCFGVFAQNPHLYEYTFDGEDTLPTGWSIVGTYGWQHSDDEPGDNGFLYAVTPGGGTAVGNTLYTSQYALSLKDTLGFISFDLETVSLESDPNAVAVSVFMFFVVIDNDLDNPIPLTSRLEIESGYANRMHVNIDINEMRETLGLTEADRSYQFIFYHYMGQGGMSGLALDNFVIGTKMYYVAYLRESGEGQGTMDTVWYPAYRDFVVIPGTFTRSGYSFIGWYCRDSYDNEYYLMEGDIAAIDENMRWFARWGENRTFTFNANGGTGTQEDMEVQVWSDSYWPYPSIAFLPECTYTRDGYGFLGWSTNSDLTDTLAPGDTTTTGNRTFYAVWVEGETSTITFDRNNSQAYGFVNPKVVLTGSQITLPACSYQADGCNFVEWNTAADGTGTSYDAGATYTVSADVTLYAIWRCGSTGIEKANLSNVRIYPNPTTDMLHVSGTTLNRIEVMDLAGRSLLSVYDANAINLSSLSKGVYMVRLVSGNDVAFRKVVKK